MILVIYGTRPEAIKLAPIVAAARAKHLTVWAHCTNQSPDLDPDSILSGDSHGSLDAANSMFAKGVQLAVVQGDTRTAMTGALWAYERGIPVFHVEAGVRTYDLASPWPEEGYRRMIGQIATYHACSTLLCGERVVSALYQAYRSDMARVPSPDLHKHVRVTGSPVVDAVREWQRSGNHTTLVEPRHAVITLHRRENREHFANILTGIHDALGVGPYCWPSHPNHWAVDAIPLRLQSTLMPILPLGRDEFLSYCSGALVVITDSGGVQEEMNALGIPVVVCRTVTDRPESLGAGGAYLGGVTTESVSKAIRDALRRTEPIDTTIFGDGTASEQIASWWKEIVG